MLRIVLVALSAVVMLAGGWALLGGSAQAQPAFKKYFDQKYFTKGSKLEAAHTTSSCNFCHIGGTSAESRKNRNALGQALDKLLSKEDADNLTFKVKNEKPEVYKAAEEKVLKALETVEKQPSDPKAKKSPTFGELIKNGTLPKSPATDP
jgi:hypothetical protein